MVILKVRRTGNYKSLKSKGKSVRIIGINILASIYEISISFPLYFNFCCFDIHEFFRSQSRFIAQWRSLILCSSLTPDPTLNCKLWSCNPCTCLALFVNCCHFPNCYWFVGTIIYSYPGSSIRLLIVPWSQEHCIC